MYVGLTRGKEANHLYVETEEARPMSDVLATIVGHSDGMPSAAETIRAERARADDLALIDQTATSSNAPAPSDSTNSWATRSMWQTCPRSGVERGGRTACTHKR